MLSAGDFRRGSLFEMDGNIYIVVDFQHVKPARGGAFMRAKIKNILTNINIERTFNTFDKFDEAIIESKDMQFLYRDGDIFYFMDMDNYEQTLINIDIIDKTVGYLKENDMAKVSFFKDKVIMVEAPMFVDLKVIDCDPPITSEGAKMQYKSAKLETGITIQVPVFINIGDVIKIDTRNDEYRERI